LLPHCDDAPAQPKSGTRSTRLATADQAIAELAVVQAELDRLWRRELVDRVVSR
jgi:hypothetical protein